MRRFALLTLTLLLSVPARAGDLWEPEKTHALIVGILEWTDKNLGSFPKEGRRDRVLEKTLIDAGVPRGQVTFLEDKDATQKAIQNGLREIAAKAGPGSTLIFYFAGHGIQDDGGETYLANHDADTSKKKATAVAMADVSRIIRNQFKGSRVIICADCCYSGALARASTEIAAELKIPSATMTSATASNVSTGEWTFTEALIGIFGGSGIPDANRDGSITLREADAWITSRMRFEAGQLTKQTIAGGFDPDFVVRPVEKGKETKEIPGPWKVGDFCEVEEKKVWYRAIVLDGRDGGECQIHYIGWDAKYDEWVPANRMRKPQGIKFAAGDAVQVEWNKKWYPAKIMQIDTDFAYIHFDGYGNEWDEWVTAKRLKKK